MEPLTARCQVTHAEWTNAARALTRRNPVFWAALTVGAIAVAVGAALGSVLVLVCGVVVIGAFGIAYHTPGRASLVGASKDDERGTTVFVASEEGFGLDPSSTGVRVWCAWSHYQSFRRLDDVFLLQHVRLWPRWRKKGLCTPTLIVPLRAFDSAEDADRFRELALRHINEHSA